MENTLSVFHKSIGFSVKVQSGPGKPGGLEEKNEEEGEPEKEPIISLKNPFLI